MQYVKQVLIALDQLLNALAGGMSDETLSARAHRQRLKGNPFFANAIDTVLFFDRDHCKEAYLSEVNRKQLPKDYTREE